MDLDLIAKLGFGLISSLGTVGLISYNFGQARKVRADLVEKLEEAVSRKSIHSVTELFRLIHGLRMSYADITELIQHDECTKIIYALKKTPGMVSYSGGKFKYTGIAGNRVFRFIDGWFTRISITLFGALALGSLAMFVFSQGAGAVAGFIFLLVCSFVLTFQLRQRNYDRMIRNLVEPGHNDQMQPTVNVPTN